MTVHERDVLIVGAGFAGAATAFHLSRAFGGSITILEREPIPGAHASGRNAAMLRQSVAHPEIRLAAARSREAYQRHQGRIQVQPTGSLLLGARDSLEALREPSLAPSRYLDAAEAIDRIPLLRGHRFEAALSTPGDGVVDVSGLLDFYLGEARRAGVEVRTACEVSETRGGPPYTVATAGGVFRARWLVNAAGAWAAELGARAGAARLPLTACKRHLFLLEGVPGVDPQWPFLWNVERDCYFRPESGGLLFSMCDETACDPVDETPAPGITEALAEFIFAHLPELREARIRRTWACCRTWAEDGSFVVGWDPVRESLLWVAGLGGHGMGCSWEVGRLAADLLLGRRAPPRAFDPARFVAPLTRAHGADV